MARESSGGIPIETRDQLVAELESGAKPRDQWRIGTEHEKFGFYRSDLTPVPYDGPRGIHVLLETMAGLLGWQPVEEAGQPIGLTDPLGHGAISLEPGGQFELSGAPLETIHQTCRELNAHLSQLREGADPLGISFLGVGFSPLWTLAETPMMPKERYRIMRAYMPKVSDHDGWPPSSVTSADDHPAGLDMMFRTCSVQANLDFADEADMRMKMRVAMALQPIATAMFANSPFTEGKPNGFQSYRAEVWRHTDSTRTGILPFVFDEGFGFEAYVDWALNVPLYFVRRGTIRHDVAGAPFRDFLEGRLTALPGERATITDWDNHLTTLFPEVRLKKVIELRGADAGPWNKICAVPALWAGLLYDDDALQAASDLIRDWPTEAILETYATVPRLGLRTTIAGTPVIDVARQIVALARDGLRRRARLSENGNDETHYLDTLQEIVDTGRSPADRLLAEYRNEWHGDISEIFRRYAY
jgi:glutamate--cysteine ligase